MNPPRTISHGLVLLLGAAAAAAGQEASPQEHPARLTESQRQTRGARSVAERSRIHADAVAAVSGNLAAHAVGIKGAAARRNLTRVFRSAALEAGAATPIAPTAGEVAYRHLPALLAVQAGRRLPNRQDAERAVDLIERARIEDVARLVTQDLGLPDRPSPPGRLGHEIRAFVPTRGRSEAQVDRLPERPAPERPLTDTDLRALRLALWAIDAVQAQRARFDPKRAGGEVPFDLKLKNRYQHVLADELHTLTERVERYPGTRPTAAALAVAARPGALVRVVFEIAQGLDALRQAHAALKHDTARAFARANRNQLGLLYVDELRRKTRAQLIAEAAAQGLHLGDARSRLDVVRRLSGLSRRAVLERVRLRRPQRPGVSSSVRGAALRLRDLIPGQPPGRRVRR